MRKTRAQFRRQSPSYALRENPFSPRSPRRTPRNPVLCARASAVRKRESDSLRYGPYMLLGTPYPRRYTANPPPATIPRRHSGLDLALSAPYPAFRMANPAPGTVHRRHCGPYPRHCVGNPVAGTPDARHCGPSRGRCKRNPIPGTQDMPRCKFPQGLRRLPQARREFTSSRMSFTPRRCESPQAKCKPAMPFVSFTTPWRKSYGRNCRPAISQMNFTERRCKWPRRAVRLEIAFCKPLTGKGL